MKRLAVVVLSLAWAAAVVIAAGVGRLTDYYHTPLQAEARAQVVEIPAGASLKSIAALLEEKGVVHRATLFTLAARLAGQGRRIRAGEYYLSPAMSPSQIVRRLTTGPPVLHKVTIPEGLTMEEVARILAEKKLTTVSSFMGAATDKDFVLSLGIPALTVEGYLFPETYHLPRGLSAEAIIQVMVNRFKKVYAELKAKYKKTTHLTDFQTVILASMVEAEIQTPAEGPLVAAVYVNRLKRGMLLQCDPTVIYGLKNFKGRLRKFHLKASHAYNTYIHPGLPPGPISNPGENALKSALNPADVGFLYFVSRRDGTHEFSYNYRQHRKAIETYKRR